MQQSFTHRLQELSVIAAVVVLGFWFAVYSLSSGCHGQACALTGGTSGAVTSNMLDERDFELVNVKNGVETFLVKTSSHFAKATLPFRAS